MSYFGLGLISGGSPGNDAFTKILLHFDGANGSQTFTDSNAGGTSKTWSVIGGVANTTLTTSGQKFGTAALSLPFLVNVDAITTPYSADFNFGSQDWTIDFWYTPNVSSASTSGLCGIGDELALANVALMIWRNSGGTLTASMCNTSASVFSVTSTTTFTTAVQRHIAFVRTGNTIKLFIDGVQEGGNVSVSGSIPNMTGYPFRVGAAGSSAVHTKAFGIYDEFRLSVGIARWTANFTPPTSAYT
ncbi:LamG-like jellyroll fold domain-containing protein [Afipia sp. DC4300-2b1]|uniref:LamG-like jellyroll fold domain-containing protein n=1 Tax=Afipia sp. DC4300-2b1 TaxID=2804672 RepID=UPI003CEBF322